MDAKLGFSAIILGVVIVIILTVAGIINTSFQNGQLTTTTINVRNETVDNATNTTRSYRVLNYDAPGFSATNTSFTFYVNSTIITNVQMLTNGSVNVSNTSLNPSCGAYAAPNGRCSINYTFTYQPRNSAYNISQSGNQLGTNYASQMGIMGTILIAVFIVGLIVTGLVMSKRY